MRILILNYEYPPLGGGAANATKYILRELSKQKNLEIDLVTSSVADFRIERPYKNITIHYLDIGKGSKRYHSQSNKDLLSYSWKAYKYSRKLIREKEFDFIHAFFGIPCGFIAKRLGLPYIVSLRGADVPFYSRKYRLLDKIIFRRLSKNIWAKAEHVIANSKGLRDLALYSSPEQKIKVIYNGIDIEEFFYNEKKTRKTEGDKIKVLCVGRLIERKGFSYVIEAIKPLKEHISLSFVGEGPMRDELKRMAKEIDVKFLGIVEHERIADIYSEHDVFVLPSFNEGMSNAVLEAMAAGLGIIVTQRGGALELLRDNGFEVRAGNSSDITRSLNNYLNNFELLRRHGRKSRELAITLGWENVSREYLDIYNRMNKKRD